LHTSPLAPATSLAPHLLSPNSNTPTTTSRLAPIDLGLGFRPPGHKFPWFNHRNLRTPRKSHPPGSRCPPPTSDPRFDPLRNHGHVASDVTCIPHPQAASFRGLTSGNFVLGADCVPIVRAPPGLSLPASCLPPLVSTPTGPFRAPRRQTSALSRFRRPLVPRQPCPSVSAAPARLASATSYPIWVLISPFALAASGVWMASSFCVHPPTSLGCQITRATSLCPPTTRTALRA